MNNKTHPPAQEVNIVISREVYNAAAVYNFANIVSPFLQEPLQFALAAGTGTLFLVSLIVLRIYLLQQSFYSSLLHRWRISFRTVSVLKMPTKFGDEKCGHSNSLEKEEEEEEEESLSLSDLPLNKDDENHLEKEESQQLRELAQEDFNFNSSGGSVLAESEMCAADEVFFQGQILPFRHSISSEAGLAMFRTDIHPFISRSQSMDHRYSGGGFTSRSSSTRSSSIRSNHNSLNSGSSSSSSSGTNTRTPLIKRKPPRARTHNQFHSHPSPTPQIRISSTGRHKNTGHRRGQKSTIWSFFQVGLVRTPDIKLPDLKIRSSNITNTSKNFGSRNSNSTTTSTSASSMDKNKQWRFFDRKGTLFGGCRCSVDAVDQTVSPRIVRIKNGSVNYETIGKEETGEETNKKQKGKHAMSRHHRTFEWLKQLSVEGGPDDE